MLLSHIFITIAASAALLSGTPGSKSVDFQIEKSKGSLSLVGQGLRKKKVAFISVKVYDAFLYAADPAAFKRTDSEALNSFADQKASAVQLKFLRDVDSDRIVTSYKESFEGNKVDLNSAPIKEMLAKVQAGGEIKEGQTMTLLGLKEATGETLLFENGKGEVSAIKGPPGFLQQVFSIWLGNTPESTMKDLKESFLKQP